ncbi:hypothetical protein AWW66_17905 [Micromonospora rosaria]|uniref:Fenitrothion hydrolase n=1 Tax=Micromonospora rosaria TaxID=47874 RepID=A0A136PQI6_9ACTN|nr:hypothetical protein [Micromonospora rosaria]KXK60634.1 hypothetical protein AWW66_17905 [Micromonospora rosaria]
MTTYPELLAHGVGGRQDLPLPLTHLVVAASLTLVITFVALGALWRVPRLDRDGTTGQPVPRWLAALVDAPALRWALRGAGLVAGGYVCLALLGGPDNEDNPAAGVLYVLVWIGLVPLSLLFGPVWRAVNPLRSLYLLLCVAAGRDPERGLRPLPAGLGVWPAAVGLVAFVWLELVAPGRATLPVINAWLAGYALVMLVGAVRHGVGWFDRADPFELYSGLIGRLAVIGRRDDGAVVWRNPLDGMAALRPEPGLVTAVVVLLGSTMYDSLSYAPGWLRLGQFAEENGVPPVVTGTLGMGVLIGLVALAYLGATRVAALVGHGAGPEADGESTPPRLVPGELAHSIVPIAVGYVLAHYYSLLVLEGQRTIALLSDPLGTGADWLGTAGFEPYTGLITPDGVAALQITVILIGHLLGSLLAHDRALSLFPRARAVTGQLPMLVLMVAYTAAGLLLLYAG